MTSPLVSPAKRELHLSSQLQITGDDLKQLWWAYFRELTGAGVLTEEQLAAATAQSWTRLAQFVATLTTRTTDHA